MWWGWGMSNPIDTERKERAVGTAVLGNIKKAASNMLMVTGRYLVLTAEDCSVVHQTGYGKGPFCPLY